MNIIHIKIILLAYLIGSIPTTFLIVKLITGKNISKEGSGNIGAMNSFETTGKFHIGIISFILDFLKGALSVYLVTHLFYSSSATLSLATIGAVVGHNYSMFMKFKGGRGLSTAAGAFSMINPFCIFLWLIMFFASKYVISKNVHIANVAACLISAFLIWHAPNYTLNMFFTFNLMQFINYKKLYIIISAIIIISHYKPLLKLYTSKKKKS